MKLIKFQLGGVPAKKLESKEATPFMNFFKFLIPGFKLAYDQKLALKNYDAKIKALYRVRIPLQEAPESIYKPKVQLAKKPLTAAPVALNKPITKHLLGTTKGGLPTAQKVEDSPVERADNTRVASRRPLVILNRIPWGAGKGQAGQNPLVYLWNNPYVAGTMMAMSPLVKPKVQYDIFPVKEVSKFSFLPLKEIMTRMTTKYGNYLNIKGPKGRINAWKIERQPGVDNFTEIQNLLFK